MISFFFCIFNVLIVSITAISTDYHLCQKTTTTMMQYGPLSAENSVSSLSDAVNQFYFGGELENIGDLDNNGYDDVAIMNKGAADDGNLVILFLGADGDIILEKRLVVITSHNPAQRGFGLSMFPQNSFGTDEFVLAIGVPTWESNGVVVLMYLDSGGNELYHDIIGIIDDPFVSAINYGGFVEAGGVSENRSKFGAAVQILSDLDDDGTLDMAVMAEGEEYIYELAPILWIVFLQTTAVHESQTPGQTLVKSLIRIDATGAGFNDVADANLFMSLGDYGFFLSTFQTDYGSDGLVDYIVGYRNDAGMHARVFSVDNLGNVAEVSPELDASITTRVIEVDDMDNDGIRDIIAGYGTDVEGGFGILYMNSDFTVKASRYTRARDIPYTTDEYSGIGYFGLDWFGNQYGADDVPEFMIGAYQQEDTPGGLRVGRAYMMPAIFCNCTNTPFIGALCDDPCENGGICKGDITQCECVPGSGYIGTNCQKPCLNGGVDQGSSWAQCDCTGTNHITSDCGKSCNNGIADEVDFTSCDCTDSGATGKFCTEDVDDCLSSPCANSGVCSDYGADFWPNHANEFNCTCAGDYRGPTCEDTLCVSSPCLNNGACVNGQDVVCNCTLTGGYEGEFCQNEIDECASSPCLNDGDCTDLLGDFNCDCTGTGYEGKTCAIDVDDCLSSPCEHDSVCEDKGTNKFKCTCDEFWTGDTCSEDVDDCILKSYYCENGATCADDPLNMGDVTCTCVVELGGFTGKYCDVPIESACVTFSPCFHGGKCILDDITYAMSCDCTDTGYEGDVCDVQAYVSECVSSPCLNQGQCYDPSATEGDWYCDCGALGYFGDLCELTACHSNPCQNGGTCTDSLGGGYTCSCVTGYSGTQCEVNDADNVGITDSQLSSSSSSIDLGEIGTPNGSGTTKTDNTGMIAGIVIGVAIVIAIAIYFVYHQTRTSGKLAMVMPT